MEPQVRDIDFEFPDDIPFLFNPRNLAMSKFANAASFLAPAFERFVIKAIRSALHLVSDSEVRDNAQTLCNQEAQHAKHHIAHLRMLIEKNEQLRGFKEQMDASYDDILENRPLEEQLAYAATIELTFGVMCRFMIDEREALFAGGDDRIASFLLWHFVEEHEHSSIAYNVYDDVVGRSRTRLAAVPWALGHFGSLLCMTLPALEEIAPTGHPTGRALVAELTRGIPARRSLATLVELSARLGPRPGAALQAPSEWISRWREQYARGSDMRRVEL